MNIIYQSFQAIQVSFKAAPRKTSSMESSDKQTASAELVKTTQKGEKSNRFVNFIIDQKELFANTTWDLMRFPSAEQLEIIAEKGMSSFCINNIPFSSSLTNYFNKCLIAIGEKIHNRIQRPCSLDFFSLSHEDVSKYCFLEMIDPISDVALCTMLNAFRPQRWTINMAYFPLVNSNEKLFDSLIRFIKDCHAQTLCIESEKGYHSTIPAERILAFARRLSEVPELGELIISDIDFTYINSLVWNSEPFCFLLYLNDQAMYGYGSSTI